eukprot:scaffold54944_cov69-Phaeocystis_antarctica.AAC.1
MTVAAYTIDIRMLSAKAMPTKRPDTAPMDALPAAACQARLTSTTRAEPSTTDSSIAAWRAGAPMVDGDVPTGVDGR